MSGIFVNYRQNYYPNPASNELERCTHAQVVEAIAERLAQHFGPDQVFLDTELRLAARWPEELRAMLHRSDLVIAVIHEDWLADLEDRKNRLRLDEKDGVRLELETAFAAPTHVLPVLIDKARLPGQRELPDSIAGLGLCQAHRIQFGHWQRDVNRLIQAMELYVRAAPVQQEREKNRSDRNGGGTGCSSPDCSVCSPRTQRPGCSSRTRRRGWCGWPRWRRCCCSVLRSCWE